MKIPIFSYLDKDIPLNYKCGVCGKFGIRLYREYNTFVDKATLTCTKCTCNASNRNFDEKSKHSIGWHVAAVPTEEGGCFWGFTSVPPKGVDWWDNLPVDKE